MCIPTDYKYKPHPPLMVLPNLHDIRCVMMLNYELEETNDKICVECYEREQPENYEYVIRHGLLYGRLNPLTCRCGNEVISFRSISQCNQCSNAYTLFINYYRGYYSYEISYLAIDVLSLTITSLSVYNENGLEVEVYLG